MVILLTLLTAGYLLVVLGVRRSARAGRAAAAGRATGTLSADLPAEDRPPVTAVGWPPDGGGFTSYVDEGVAALDAYLAEGFAA